MSKVKVLVFSAIFVALISICAWIQIPFAIPFTLQTFAIFLTLLCLGGKYGTFTIFCYILLGLIGVPVFSGFKGGIAVFVLPTGGFILGFLVIGFIFWIFEHFNKNSIKILSLFIGLILLYIFGTLWFVFVSSRNKDVGFVSALMTCVVPFIIPDLIKLALAYLISIKLKNPLSKSLKK